MGFLAGDVEGNAESQDLDHFGLATALRCDPGEDTSSAWATCTASVWPGQYQPPTHEASVTMGRGNLWERWLQDLA